MAEIQIGDALLVLLGMQGSKKQIVELEFPKIEVRFRHLKVESYVHVGSRALPTIPNFIFNMTEAFLRQLWLRRGKRKKLTILDDISGIIRPSRLTLLLGPPSSRKMTLLLALAGRLRTDLQICLWNLQKREKIAGIKPDEDLDIFMKALAFGGQETTLVVECILKMNKNKDRLGSFAEFYKETHYNAKKGKWATLECEKLHAEMEIDEEAQASQPDAISLIIEQMSIKHLRARSGIVKGIGMRPSSSLRTTATSLSVHDDTVRLFMEER